LQTYSPWTGEFNAGSEYFFTYNMQHPIGTNASPFNLLGTMTNVPSGNIASVVWSNLQVNTAYEWYVVVSDALSNTTTGPIWRFSTAPNSPPVTSNSVVTIVGDAPVLLTLPAYDANGDALTFETNTVPTHGVNLNFNTNNGTITYVPTHGFRGQDRFTYRASDRTATSSAATYNMNIVSPPDTNGNQLPDAWEAAYGITNASADNDGDGRSNLEEYWANTNPTNAASVLRISQALRGGNGHVTLSWPSVGGMRYRVQFSNGGANGSFTGVFTDVVRPLNVEMDPAPYNSPSTQSFVDDFTLIGGSPGTTRYYRIKVVQ
jgi:hypothetical protein